MEQTTRASPDIGEGDPGLLADLAVLCDGPSITIHLSFDGGLIAMRSNDQMIFGTSAERGWQVATAEARVQLFLGWLRQAARLYRERKPIRAVSDQEVA